MAKAVQNEAIFPGVNCCNLLPANEEGKIQRGMNAPVQTSMMMIAKRRPVYCEKYPAMIPPTTAPQFEMMAILLVSGPENSLLSCKNSGRRSWEAWDRKLKPVIKQT